MHRVVFKQLEQQSAMIFLFFYSTISSKRFVRCFCCSCYRWTNKKEEITEEIHSRQSRFEFVFVFFIQSAKSIEIISSLGHQIKLMLKCIYPIFVRYDYDDDFRRAHCLSPISPLVYLLKF